METAAIDEFLAKLASERGALLAQARSLTEADASRVPLNAEGEAEWTAKEQWAHIAESEANYRAWVIAAIERDNPDLRDAHREPVGVPLAHANYATAKALIDQLEDQRARTMAVLARLSPGQYDRPATLDLFGTLTVLQWARSFYRHDRMHVDQIGGRQPSFRPNFAGGAEPDQRLRRSGG